MDGTVRDPAEIKCYRVIEKRTGECIGTGIAGAVRALMEDRGLGIEKVYLRDARTDLLVPGVDAAIVLSAATPLRNRLTTQEERDDDQDALNELDQDDARAMKAEIIRCAEGAHAEQPQYRGYWDGWSAGRMEVAYETPAAGIREGDVVLFRATPGDPHSPVSVYAIRVGANLALGPDYEDAVTALGPGEGEADSAIAEATRGFLLRALRHDAADDAVTELLFEHVVKGRYHPTVVANSLAPILEEVAQVADLTDWEAAADHVLDPEAEPPDPEGSRRSERGTVFGIVLIRDFLRVVVEAPIVRERLHRRPEVGDRGVTAARRSAAVREELTAALRSGTEEDWNIIAGQLIAEARDVCGPAAAEGAAA